MRHALGMIFLVLGAWALWYEAMPQGDGFGPEHVEWTRVEPFATYTACAQSVAVRMERVRQTLGIRPLGERAGIATVEGRDILFKFYCYPGYHDPTKR
jgi:hypothetical protein